MKTRSVFALCSAMLLPVFTFAADLVRDYMVDGTTYTRSEGWSALDVGMTIVMKYENLPAEGDDVSLMTLSQYAPNGDESKVGLCSRARLPRGTWNGGYWNNAQNTSTTSLGESGVIVCVYKPVKGTDQQGLLAYSSTGALIFSANGLKSTTDGSTVGKKIVITEYVTDLAIYQGEVAAEDISALVTAFNQPSATSVYEPFLTTEYVKTTIRAESLEDLLVASYSATMKGGNIGGGSAEATGYFVTKSSDNELTVELQAINGETKCVLLKLMLDDEGYVSVKAVKAAWMAKGTALGTQFFEDENKVSSANDATVVTSTTGKGYGIAELTITVKNVGDTKIPDGTLKYGYDFNGGVYQLETGATGNHLACGDIAADISGDALNLGSRAEKHYGTGFSYGDGAWSIAIVSTATSVGEVIYAVGGQRGTVGLIGLRNAGDNTIEAFTKGATKLTSVTLTDDPKTAYHLYTIVYSASKLRMNVDGGAFTDAVDFTTGTGDQWQFGGIHGGFSGLSGVKNATSGLLDEFRVYTMALNRAQTYKIAEEFGLVGDEEAPIFDPETDTIATNAVLRFSEIMPKPSDKPYSITTQAGYDKNGLESGWVELENTSETEWANLKDYKFCRANRGKVYTHADYGNFPEVMIPPRGRFTFYTSERYSNSYPEAKDGNTSAFEHGTFDGKPIWHNDMLIWGDKVNPKKFPYVTLAYHPETAAADEIIDTVIIPSDTPEGYSIIVGEKDETSYTKRWICATPTFNKANTDTAKLTPIGPNVGPKYGVKHSLTEFAPAAPAKSGELYTVTLNVNPVYRGTEKDAISKVILVYRTKLDKGVSGEVEMEMTGTDEGGDVWTGVIPASAIPTEPGQLIQWKTKITDAAGNEWTSPSFMNPDDGYEWYGTITEPGDLNSAKLPTWHMFIDDASKAQMDIDADKQTLENNARVAIYDSSTSNYYDYVRIDLRGNTSAHFNKKSHGLRFSKVNPLTMYDPVRKTTWSGVRKSSLIGEPADPSFMRQMIGFWLWNKMGNLTPFDFPVRCNLNGEFYQLGFHSERFTDELIEDIYKLDKYGYGYKNVGTLMGTTAGGAEKKTPDDGNETDMSMLNTNLVAYLSAAKNVNEDNAELTKVVVERFDLPAWINYLASARITQEMDDVWANISIYRDSAEMKEGARGTGAWMPLGYDFNVSFGQYYHDGIDLRSENVLMANQDWFKSHPFYGGMKVRCHSGSFSAGTVNNGNLAMEAVYQSSKFRRLYLRRLRTLMDQELKAPGTPESEVPFMVKMREMAEMMKEDAAADRAKYGENGWSSSFNSIDSWGKNNWPATISEGVDNIWEKYVVPRREHLYVTHSITNEKFTVGYGSELNAGIPLAQSPIPELKDKITISGLTTLSAEDQANLLVDSQFYTTDAFMILNSSDEDIDMSGWKFEFSVDYELPAGTVCPMHGYIYVVADRRAYVAAHEATLTDQIIVGNATMSGVGPIRFMAADGTVIVEKIPRTDARDYLRLDSFYGNTSDPTGDVGEWITIKNISNDVTLNFKNDPVTICFLKDGDPEGGDHCHFTLSKGTLKPGATMTLKQADYAEKGWVKIQNNKQIITISDKYGTTCEQLKVTQKNFDLAYGNGAYLKIENGVWRQVYDLAIGTKVYTLDLLEEVAAQFADGVVIRLGVEATIDEEAQTIAFAADKVLAIPTENFTITVADQKASLGFKQITLTAKVQPDAGEIPEGATVYSGEVEGDIDLAAGTYYLNGANFTGNVTCSGAVTLHLVSGTENTAKFIDASAAGLTIKGMGKLSMSGTDTLIKAKTMVVNEGVLSIEFSGDVEKKCAVLLTGPYIQNGGEVTIDLDSEVQVYGFFLDTATKTSPAVELNGGVFNSTIMGSYGYNMEMEGGVPGSATFKLNKGSNDAYLNGTTNHIVSAGFASRFINTDGHIYFTENCGEVSVSSADILSIGANIFKSAKSLEIAGGTITGDVFGLGSEIFCSDLEIVVSGGVINVAAADDCFSSKTNISVTGGIVHAISGYGDALDSNGSMSITGGHVFAFTKSSEHEALDVMPSAADELTHTLTIDAGATVVAVSGKTPEVTPEGTATFFTKSFASTSNKFVGFTTVTETETEKTTKSYAVSWEGKIAASPTIIIAGSGLTDAKADIKNPGKDNPDYIALDGAIEKITIKTTTEEITPPEPEYPEGALVIKTPGNYDSVITDAEATCVVVDVGAGNIVTFTQANSFTGGLYVYSGTAAQTYRSTNNSRFGGFGANNFDDLETMCHIYVKEGATLDLANTVDACYIIHSAGTIVNSGSTIGVGSRQMTQLILDGDTTIKGNTFGIVRSGHDDATLDMNGHTLTLDMASETTQFVTAALTIKNPGVIKIKNGRFFIKADKDFAVENDAQVALDVSAFELNTVVVTGKVAALGSFVLAEGQAGWSLDTSSGSLTAVYVEPMPVLADENESAEEVGLMISEIMPKASVWDENHCDSGWLEVVNVSQKNVNFGDYAIARFNRGKAVEKLNKWVNNVKEKILAPGERLVIKTSEDYSHADDKTITQYGEELGNVIVLAAKVNPKKYPMVVLVKGGKVVQRCVVPVDVPEDKSVCFDGEDLNGAKVSRICTATMGTRNALRSGIPVGPQISSLYGVADAEDYWTAFDKATVGTDYTVSVPVNPIVGGNEKNEIASVNLIYQIGFGEIVTNEVAMTKSGIADPLNGAVYSGAIPGAAIQGEGQLVRWAVKITDKAGNAWRSPSFNNPEDGFEWYGTITTPSESQTEGGITTFHLFIPEDIADGCGTIKTKSNCLMNIDADDATYTSNSRYPYGAYVGIYDNDTGMYYDKVRIDKRGNTSGSFTKKAHGLKFAKAQSFKGIDSVTGKEIECRKSSFTAEYADPSFVRQGLSFKTLNDNGSKAPFHYPVRLNLNGEFYQLAFHTERFSDELIEDFYGLDGKGYGYKNIGPFNPGVRPVSGGIEKKTPDDGVTSDDGVLNAFCAKMADCERISEDHTKGDPTPTADSEFETEFSKELTKVVATDFDLPAWLNYIALTKITGETDDVWANLSGYYDVNGTGTWMPLAYDMNQSFGQWHLSDDWDYDFGDKCPATDDHHKAHPLYGGLHIMVHYSGGAPYSSSNNKTSATKPYKGNRCFESIFQNAKYRRLYLRRLRTLMDAEFGGATADQEHTPIYQRAKAMVERYSAVAAMDRKIWTDYQTQSASAGLWVFGYKPEGWTAEEGLDWMWTEYIQPRRQHLYVTHGISDPEGKGIGYGETKCAGIPAAQSATLSLRDKITAEYVAEKKAVVIRNANAETIDLSNWKLEGPVNMTLPAGTVIDQAIEGVAGELYVSYDRKATVAAFGETLHDQIIVGNGTFGKETAAIALTAADETKVIFTPTPEYYYLRLHSFDGCTAVLDGDDGEWFALTNVSDSVGLNLEGVRVQFLKAGDEVAKMDVMLPACTLGPNGLVKFFRNDFDSAVWDKITNNEISMTIWDSNYSVVQTASLKQKSFANYYGTLGNKTGDKIGGAYYLEATSFGETLAQADFKEVAYPATTKTWEEATEITDETPMSELLPEAQATTLVNLGVKPTTLANWAKSHHATDTLGTEINLEAFALDCAPSEVATKKEAFTVTITFAEDGSIKIDPTIKLNIKPTIQGSTDLETWHNKTDGDSFFKAVIQIGE